MYYLVKSRIHSLIYCAQHELTSVARSCIECDQHGPPQQLPQNMNPQYVPTVPALPHYDRYYSGDPVSSSSVTTDPGTLSTQHKL